MTEAIDEYLVSQGIDSTDFVNKANSYQYNNSAVVVGDVNGSIAVGPKAKASQSGVKITTGVVKGSAQ